MALWGGGVKLGYHKRREGNERVDVKRSKGILAVKFSWILSYVLLSSVDFVTSITS
jgi:hypothetical protein